MNKYRIALIATTVVVLLIAVASISASPVRQLISPSSDSVPQTMTYQGVLTDTNGNAVNNGQYTVTFRLYTRDTGGSSIWSERHQVTVQGGLFSVQLGSEGNLASALENGPELYLGITVGSGPELSPRQPLTSVPFAVRAKDAETLNGADAQDIVDAAIAGSIGNQDEIVCAVERRLVNSVDSYVPSETCIPTPMRIFTDVTDPVTPAMAIRSDGTPVIARVTYDGGLYITDCKDVLCKSHTSRSKIDSELDVVGSISLVIDSQDHAIVTFYTRTTETLNLLICMNTACNASETVQLFDEDSRKGFSNAMVLDGDGLPFIIHSRQSFGAYHDILQCEDIRCDESRIRQLGGGSFSQTEHYMDSAVRPNGNPVFSYFWKSQKRTHLGMCVGPDCEDVFGAAYPRSDADFEEITGTSVATDSNGFAAGAFTHGDSLYYFICETETCGPQAVTGPDGDALVLKSIERLDQVNGAGPPALFGVSMVMLPDDTPLFSYIDEHVGLMVVRCDNRECTAVKDPVRLAQGASVGTDIVLGPDGVPYIAYIQNDPLSNNVPRPYVVRCEQCLDW